MWYYKFYHAWNRYWNLNNYFHWNLKNQIIFQQDWNKWTISGLHKSVYSSLHLLLPCLWIPSLRFLTRERSRSKNTDKEKEKDREKSMAEKRRLTTESIGAPILREPWTHLHTHSHTVGSAIGHGVVEKGELKAAKASLVQLCCAAHGMFNFE